MHLKRTGIVQGKHADKALSVHLFLRIAYQHLKRLNHSQGDKILDLSEGPDKNIKMMHPETSYCTNSAFCVIMVLIPNETHKAYYNRLFCGLQLGKSTIYTKIDIRFW